MAGSIISAMALNKVPKPDPNFFGAGRNLTKLDVVVNSQTNAGNAGSKQNSIQKIASFKPTQLKDFSARIEKSVAQRKQSAEVGKARDQIAKQKMEAVKKENPSTKNNPAEAQTGGKVNIST